MSDLIDKIARDRAEKLAPDLAKKAESVGVHGIYGMLEREIASAMREAVRLSGGEICEVCGGHGEVDGCKLSQCDPECGPCPYCDLGKRKLAELQSETK